LEGLYKKAVVLARGYFSRVDPAHRQIRAQMLAAGVQEPRQELEESSPIAIGIFSVSAAPLRPDALAQKCPDLLRRIDALLARGGNVLLFRERELYAMTALVNRYTKGPVRFVADLSVWIRAFTDP
jgi:hypothetical protein